MVGADGREFVLADIPGLIEGASEGVGLGDRFLGHVERCAALLHLVDGTSEDPAGEMAIVEAELEAYGAGLIEKRRIVGLNKIAALAPDEIEAKRAALIAAGAEEALPLSGATGAGVTDVLRRLEAEIAAARAPAAEEAAPWSPV